MLSPATVRARRLEMGLSAVRLAAEVGCGESTVRAWEVGRRWPPRTPALRALAAALRFRFLTVEAASLTPPIQRKWA